MLVFFSIHLSFELTAPAVNFSQTRIDEIATRRDALDTANNIQEKFKGSMLAFTEQRIIKLNLQPHGLQSTSDSNGMYGFGNAPAGAATLNIAAPLYNVENIAVVIDPANPQVLNVQLTPIP